MKKALVYVLVAFARQLSRSIRTLSITMSMVFVNHLEYSYVLDHTTPRNAAPELRPHSFWVVLTPHACDDTSSIFTRRFVTAFRGSFLFASVAPFRQPLGYFER